VCCVAALNTVCCFGVHSVDLGGDAAQACSVQVLVRVWCRALLV
jgi:hypothetical protein